MTGILVRPEHHGKGSGQSPLVMLEPAFSTQTKEVAHRVQALQNSPSPGSLRPETTSMFPDSSLQERFFDALANVKILTSRIAMHLDQEWRDRLFQQLDSLHDLDEWEDGDQPVQQPSFATFLKAMLNINPERRPGLGLSNAGHLIAAWTTNQDRLTIEFLPGDRTRWVLSRQYDDDVERFAGDTAVARLAAGLAPYNPQHWFGHAEQDHQPA
jgi:hypothetical protein